MGNSARRNETPLRHLNCTTARHWREGGDRRDHSSLTVQRDSDVQQGPASRGTRDLNLAAYDLDAVFETEQPGAFAEVRSTDSVVLY